MLCASPQPMDDNTKTPIPARKTRLRPNKSPSAPPTRINAPKKSPYDSTTHCTSTTVAPRLCCSAGRATLTTVLSINAMLEARIVAVRIHGPASSVQGTVATVEPVTADSSQGAFMIPYGCAEWRKGFGWQKTVGHCLAETHSSTFKRDLC